MAILADDALDVVARLAEQLDAEVADAEFLHLRQVAQRRLRLAVVERVAAACVGDERMRLAERVLEIDRMRFARPAAVAEVFAFGQRVREDAMLHVNTIT